MSYFFGTQLKSLKYVHDVTVTDITSFYRFYNEIKKMYSLFECLFKNGKLDVLFKLKLHPYMVFFLLEVVFRKLGRQYLIYPLK